MSQRGIEVSKPREIENCNLQITVHTTLTSRYKKKNDKEQNKTKSLFQM